MKKLTAALMLAALSTPALALDKIADEKGFSGFVDLGVATGSIESNFLARLAGIDLDLGDGTIDNFGSPNDKSITTPALNLTVKYAFSNLKTQVSFGNDLADFLQYDRSTVLALRHDFDSIGRLQVGLLTSAFPQTEVWADPYVIGETRRDTKRSSTGARLTWDRIFGSQFELKVQSREIELDDENSGVELGLSASDRNLLSREGDVMRAELGYLVVMAEGSHVLRPSVAYIDRDLDGDAMSQDGYEVILSYLYNNKSSFRLVNNIAYSSLEGDVENPIFNEVNDADQIVFASRAFFPGLFGLETWEPNVSFIWGESDSDVDFNDTAGWTLSLGIGREF